MSSPLSSINTSTLDPYSSRHKITAEHVHRTAVKDPFEELHEKIQNIELSRHRFEEDNERFRREALNSKKKLSSGQGLRSCHSSEQKAPPDTPKFFAASTKTSPRYASTPRGLVHVSCVSETVAPNQNVLPNRDGKHLEALERRCQYLEKQLDTLQRRLIELLPEEKEQIIPTAHLKRQHSVRGLKSASRLLAAEEESSRQSASSGPSSSRTPRLKRKVSLSPGELPFVVGRSTSASHHAALRMQQSRNAHTLAPKLPASKSDGPSTPSSARRNVSFSTPKSFQNSSSRQPADRRAVWCNWEEDELAFPKTPSQQAELLLEETDACLRCGQSSQLLPQSKRNLCHPIDIETYKKENGISQFSHSRSETLSRKPSITVAPFPRNIKSPVSSTSSTIGSASSSNRKFSSSQPTTKSSSLKISLQPKESKAPIWS